MWDGTKSEKGRSNSRTRGGKWPPKRKKKKAQPQYLINRKGNRHEVGATSFRGSRFFAQPSKGKK